MKEILPHIRLTDERSAITWCERNNVVVIRDGSQNYAILEHFEDAYNLPSLKCVQGYKNEPKIKRYKPKGIIAKRILKQ